MTKLTTTFHGNANLPNTQVLKYTKPEIYAMAFGILKIQSDQNYELLTDNYQTQQNSHHCLQ